MQQWLTFQRLLKESFRDLLPIVMVILFFQLVILQSVPEGWQQTALGLFIVGIGLAIFLYGLEIGIFPVGESLAKEFSTHKSKILLIFFGFLLGYGTTIAEPALSVIAEKAAAISSGRIDAYWLRQVVAASVGFAIALGVFRIITGHPIHYYIITGYVAVVSMTWFTPVEIVGLSYDLGGITTSTVTVPLVAALGIGLASNIKGRNPVIDGFGLIAFASLAPMIFVQVYGIYVYNFVDATTTAQAVASVAEASQVINITLESVVKGIIGVFGDVVPILSVILFFHYVVLKKAVKNLGSVIMGFCCVILGMYAFIVGLEMGLFSLGESMAFQLTKMGVAYVIYSFAFAIGFATTMAEPSLTAIAKKAKEISDGKIDDFTLRLFVAVGVAMGIALGSYRIVVGDSIHYYIIVGYGIVVALTMIAPKYIIPIAFDSGGVTTSTVTVPLVAALGLGLASNIPGRDPLIDGFGLIAFASLFPMITVMAYGIYTETFHIKGDHELEAQLEEEMFTDSMNIDTMNIVNIDGSNEKTVIDIHFSAVYAIIPSEKVDDAMQAASQSGASGVTIMNAHGTGLKGFGNLYRQIGDRKDNVLVFILPENLVHRVVHELNVKLHLSTTGSGLVYSIPIQYMQGISVSQKNIDEILALRAKEKEEEENTKEVKA